MNRRGEKIGWLLGWLSGYAWVGLAGIIFLYQGIFYKSLALLSYFAFGILGTLTLVPWKHPRTKYEKLMLPNLLIFIGAAGISLQAIPNIDMPGMWFPYAWFLMFLLLIPFKKLTWDSLTYQFEDSSHASRMI